jgi:DNA-binding MarR family transcriptional regulator
LQIKRESNGMWSLVADWTASPFKTAAERYALKAIASAGDDGINTRDLRKAVGGKGADVDKTVADLVKRKMVETRSGARNATLHVLTDEGRAQLANLGGID